MVERDNKEVPLRTALAGNEEALWEANRVMERLRLDYPGHAIADAYHGSYWCYWQAEARPDGTAKVGEART